MEVNTGNGPVTFNNVVGKKSLKITAGTGDVALGDVGQGGNELTGLTVLSKGATTLGGDISVKDENNLTPIGIQLGGAANVVLTKETTTLTSNGSDIQFNQIAATNPFVAKNHLRLLASKDGSIGGGRIDGDVDVYLMTLSGREGALTGYYRSVYWDPRGRYAAESIMTIPAPHGRFTFNGYIVIGRAPPYFPVQPNQSYMTIKQPEFQ